MMMNGKGFGRKWSWPNSRYCAGIHLEGLRKTTKNLDYPSRSLGLRCKLRTSRIRSRSVNHLTTMFGVMVEVPSCFTVFTPAWLHSDLSLLMSCSHNEYLEWGEVMQTTATDITLCSPCAIANCNESLNTDVHETCTKIQFCWDHK
jgi:hypothetical protein